MGDPGRKSWTPERDPFGVGSEVMLGAEHMEGMNGATATIDAAEMTHSLYGGLYRYCHWGNDQKSQVGDRTGTCTS